MVKNTFICPWGQAFPVVGPEPLSLAKEASACHSCQACTTIPRLLHKIKITTMQRQILNAFKVRPSALRWEGTEAKAFMQVLTHPYFTFN